MSETKLTPHQEEVNAEAERIRGQQKYWGDAVERDQGINNRAQALRDGIAASDNPEEEFTYDERVFANGESTQRSMLSQSELHFDANMWRAQEHFKKHEGTYRELARIFAEADGVKLDPPEIPSDDGGSETPASPKTK